YAENEGIEYNHEDFQLSRENIALLIKAYIARDLWDTKEFYQVYNLVDPIFRKAVEIIGNSGLYEAKLQAYTQ
ncbi:MAG: peptidase S41, partial [Bacteroidales bacterium]|nr:peptidase S41 [Bacteroidales bacterium]